MDSQSWRMCANDDALTGSNFSQQLTNASQTPMPPRATPGVRGVDAMLAFICLIGVVGNVLNIALLLLRRRSRRLLPLELNANLLLTALAASDLLFCVTASAYPLLATSASYLVDADRLGSLLYRYYGHAVINLSLMISMHMVVILAAERYVAMYHPLLAQRCFKPIHTVVIVGLGVLLASVATAPYFFNNMVAECRSGQLHLYELVPRWPYSSSSNQLLTGYMTRVWPALAVFLPLVVLLFCNVRLAQGLRRRAAAGMQHCSRAQRRKQRLTLVLIVIVCLSGILVTPAEVVKLINPYQTWGEHGYVVAEVTNGMQTVNFAINFMLYCVIDAEFRRSCYRVVCCTGGHAA